MPLSQGDDALLARFRASLEPLYGRRIDRVVLFGSRARGSATDASDYDVAVCLRAPFSFAREAERLAHVETEILYQTGMVINALPFPPRAYGARTALMAEIRREGIDV